MAIELLSQQYFGIKKETTRNTAQLTPDVILRIDSNTLQQKTEFTLVEDVYANRDNNTDEYANKAFVEGEISGHIDNKFIGYLLFYVCGQATPTLIAASTAYVHTFTRANVTTLPTFTAFYKSGDAGVFKSRGCVIDELELEIGESESKFKAKIKSVEETEVTDATEKTNIASAISFTAPDPKFSFGNLVLTFANDVTALGAVTNGTPATGTALNLNPSLKIMFKNNVDFDWSTVATAGSILKPLDTIAKKVEQSVEMSGLIRSKVPYTWTISQQKRAFEAMLVNTGASNVGTSTVKPELRIRVAQAIAKTEIDRPLNDALAYNIKLDNLLNSVTDGFSIQIRLINTITAY